MDAILYGTAAPIGAEISRDDSHLIIRWPALATIDGEPVGYEGRYKILPMEGPLQVPDLCRGVDLSTTDDHKVLAGRRPARVGQRWLSEKEQSALDSAYGCKVVLHEVAREHVPTKIADWGSFSDHDRPTLLVRHGQLSYTFTLISKMCVNVALEMIPLQDTGEIRDMAGNSLVEFVNRVRKVTYRTEPSGTIRRRTFEDTETDTWSTVWTGTEA